MTPTKEEIERKARELYADHCYRTNTPQLADITPELSELKENGFVSLAISELMTSEKKKYAEYMNDSGDLEVKELAEVLDLNEILASGVYCSGTSGHGKSDLMMYVSDILREHDVIIIAVDSSQDWQNRSSIPYVQTVQNPYQVNIPENSLIMDISLLSIAERQTFAENLCRLLYEHQAKTPKHLRKQYFIIFEESHVYLNEGTLRSKKFQNITRLVTEGRNFNVRFACVTQFASLISKVTMKFMRLRFFGYADEPNDLRFISGFLGSEHVKQLRNLEHGSFIHYNSGRLSLVNIEPYASSTEKVQLITPQPNIEPIQQKANSDGVIDILKFITCAGIVLYAILSMPK
jgi:hypothetical protein